MRDAMWDAAIELFAQKGFDETTVDDIAQLAGVSRRSFFRYFSSKSDLMAQGTVSYGAALTDAIEACPRTLSLSEVLRKVVLEVAQNSTAHPRTRQVMEIAAQYPSARDAQISRVAEVQEHIAEAFAKRSGTGPRGELTAHVLAGLTLCILGVTFRSWFHNHQQDISITVDQVLATFHLLIGEDKSKLRKAPPPRH